MNKITIDVAGWIGSFLILFAYYSISNGKLKSTGNDYQWLNIAGSVLLIVNTIYYGAYPSGFVNIVWALIGLSALIRRSKREV